MEKEYLKLLQHILDNGVEKSDRTGTDTKSVFGYQMRCDLSKGFPLLTTKKLHLKSIIYELLWFLKGDTNIKYLNDNGVHIWDEWADENGDLGPIYSKQWRSWSNMVFKGPEPIGCGDDMVINPGGWINEPIDQISSLIHNLKTNPDSRRHIVSAWNVAELEEMALAPCHCLFQFNCRPLTAKEKSNRFIALNIEPEMEGADILKLFEAGDNFYKNSRFTQIPEYYLDCQLYQRSADVFLGVPFNIASYALLTMMIAQVCNMIPGDFIHTFGDVHIYKNHFEQVKLQLLRAPYLLPTMKINPEVKDIFDFKYEDFTLKNYSSHPGIKAPVAV